MKKIDAHAHIGYIDGWAKVGMDAKEICVQMQEHDIVKTILCCEDNAAVWEAMQAYPDKIAAAAYINPHDTASVHKLVEYIDQGFCAVKLNPLRHAYVADAKIVDPIMEIARQKRIPVCIHCGHPPYSLPWSIAFLAERYPDVNVMMIHMGHGHGVYIDAAIQMAKRFSNLYLEMSGMPMHTKIKEAYDDVGKTRIMFGTDSPFHHPSVEIQKVMISGLNEEGLQRVFYQNAQAFFKFE